MRVKIIKNAFSGELEEEINKFISNDDIIPKDVKYCVSDTYFSALIIYEETLNEEIEILEEDDKLTIKSNAFLTSDSGTISLPDDDKISHIEEIENLSSCDLWIKNDRLNDYVANVLNKNSGIFYKKINEIIDKVNDIELDRRL